MTGRGRMAGVALASTLLFLASAASGQNGPAPGVEVVANGPALELRFHGVPLKSVRADDNQNALALDFTQPVDPAIFDRLNGALPSWIAIAYSSYDNGVIRAARPVTFLTRPEIDGFSLRLEPRVTTAQAAPFQAAPGGSAPAPNPQQSAPPPQQYSQQQQYPQQQQPYPQQGGPYPPQQYPPQQQPYPPQQQGNPQQGAPPPGQQGQAQPPMPYAPSDAFAAARNYYGLQYVAHPDDPLWDLAYGRAAARSDSGVDIGGAYHEFHNGDRVGSSHGSFRLGLGGVALLGSIYDTTAKGTNIRTATGTFAASSNISRISGEAGLGFAMGGDSEIRLEALAGASTVGGKLTSWSGTPDGFISASLIYHAADLDTPESLLDKGVRDEASLSVAQRLGYGLWGSFTGRLDNYGLQGHHDIVQTAGWNGNLRWDYEVLPGFFAGLAYDGQGDYRLHYDTLTGTVPTPYVPLSIRNLEAHVGSASLSAMLWDQLWLDAFGGYAYDRYAKTSGAVYGGGIRLMAAPNFAIELGARHTAISLQQGELGGETSAGISLNVGFGGPPRPNPFSLW